MYICTPVRVVDDADKSTGIPLWRAGLQCSYQTVSEVRHVS